MSRRAIGADGCRGGWVVITLVDGSVEDIEVVARLRDALVGSPAAVGVDMPVGLVDGRREADVEARRFLPGRGSSVFPTPPRAVIDAWRDGVVDTHTAASATAREATGQAISRQAWNLVPRIAEVDELVEAGHGVWEVHPEVAFAVVVGEPLPRKASWAGITTRRSVLRTLGIDLPDRFVGDTAAAPDDVVDAAVCAWVADAIAAQLPVLRIPRTPSQHDRGRPIAIYARRPDPPTEAEGVPGRLQDG